MPKASSGLPPVPRSFVASSRVAATLPLSVPSLSVPSLSVLSLSACVSLGVCASLSPARAAAPEAPVPVALPANAPAPQGAASGIKAPAVRVANGARLLAESVRYEGGVIVAEGREGRGVRLESTGVRLSALRLRIDVEHQMVNAEGAVLVERTRQIERRELLPARALRGRNNPTRAETVTETLRGDNFQYNFKTRRGSLDEARVELADFNISSATLLINGQRYTARNVIMRPGALTAAERAIYGTPPFNLRARSVTLEAATGLLGGGSKPRAGVSGDSSGGAANAPESGGGSPRGAENSQASSLKVEGGSLYFKNTRLLPVPSYVFRSVGGEARDPQAFSLTPRLSINSVDGALVTTQFQLPLSQRLPGMLLNADVGVSARIGFRGGLSLEAPVRFGSFTLSGRHNDIVTSQLTNRIALDREPEVTFASRLLPLFTLPGGRRAGIRFTTGVGRFAEHLIGENGDNDTQTDATREQAGVRFTTRANEVNGPYLDLFARTARYLPVDQNYRVAGLEVGYFGTLFKRVRGQFSYRASSVSGLTPFRFDRVQIRRELRSTFDIEATPRYLVPIDLRYDLSLRRLRDLRFGLLRSYKTFAYGATYQTARRELKLELRRGF